VAFAAGHVEPHGHGAEELRRQAGQQAGVDCVVPPRGHGGEERL
jgi:hypothetical protein